MSDVICFYLNFLIYYKAIYLSLHFFYRYAFYENVKS